MSSYENGSDDDAEESKYGAYVPVDATYVAPNLYNNTDDDDLPSSAQKKPDNKKKEVKANLETQGAAQDNTNSLWKRYQSPMDHDAILAASQASQGDWNFRFRFILGMPEVRKDDALRKYMALVQLSTDFVNVAESYGRVIINEHKLSATKRTIEPANIGGVAGGVKFSVRGIIFKLVKDPEVGPQRFLYGGESSNYEYAAKAAGHDLKGANAYFKEMMELAKSPDNAQVYVPMQAVVDYRGFRLVAMPLLPIGKGSLIYGSEDAGRSVNAKEPVFNALMAKAGEHMHLAAHNVAGTTVSSGGDVEGHKGTDGQYYLLDLARTFPPECFFREGHLFSTPGHFFFRMLRPEFLQLWKSLKQPPISPDVFTRWGETDAKRETPNAREATKFLFSVVIPAFAAAIDRAEEGEEDDSPSASGLSAIEAALTAGTGAGPSGPGTVANALTAMRGVGFDMQPVVLKLPISAQVHQRGINLRHIGLVRASTRRNVQARDILLIEMVARTLKHLLREVLRESLEQWKDREPSEYILQSRVVGFLNLVSGARPQSAAFWSSDVYPGLLRRFGRVGLTVEEAEDLFCAMKPLLGTTFHHLFSMTGLSLNSQAIAEMNRDPVGFEFATADFLPSVAKVKHMSILDYAKGKLLSLQAQGVVDSCTPQHQQQQQLDDELERANEGRPGGAEEGHGHGHGVGDALEEGEKKGEHQSHLHRTARLEVALRLLSLASTHYSSALRSDPINTEALIGKTQCRILIHELSGDHAGADEELGRQLDSISSGTVSDSSGYAAVVVESLFTLWRARRSTSGAMHHLGGASSLDALRTLHDKILSALPRAGTERRAQEWRTELEDAVRYRIRALLDTLYHFGWLVRNKNQRSPMPLPGKIGGMRAVEDMVLGLAQQILSPADHAALSQALAIASAEGRVAADVGQPAGASAKGLSSILWVVCQLLSLLLNHLLAIANTHDTASATRLGADREVQEKGEVLNVSLAMFYTVFNAACDNELLGVLGILSEVGVDTDGSAERRTAVMVAVQRRHHKLLEQLAFHRQSFKHEHADAQNKTVLMYLSGSGRTDLVRQCVRAGANIHLKDLDGLTALLHAVNRGHRGVSEVLLEAKADVDVQDPKDRRTALMKAVAAGRFPIAELVLKANPLVELPDANNRLVLVDAADKGHLAIVSAVLRARPHQVNGTSGASRTTALMAAAANGHIKVVRLLLSCAPKADIDAVDSQGRTALMWAIANKHHLVVKALLTANHPRPNLAIRDENGQTAMHYVAASGSKTILTLLLTTPWITLSNEVKKKQAGRARKLSIDAIGEDGEANQEIGLDGEDQDQDTEKEKVFVNLNALDDYDQTALHCACELGHADVVSLLLNCAQAVAPSLNAKSIFGGTPLMYAAKSGDVKTVKLLLGNPAVDPDLRDHNGKTARTYASEMDMRSKEKKGEKLVPLFRAVEITIFGVRRSDI